MKRPSTYADWASCLEKFKQGDDTVLKEMDEGSFALDAGTAQRFSAQVEDVYRSRKKTWLDKFNHSLQVQTIKTEADIGVIIWNAKANLTPLTKFVSAQGIPEKLRDVLVKDLNDFVAEIKKSMKDNLSRRGNNSDGILLLINSLDAGQHPQDAIKQNTTEIQTTPPTSGRKIIF